MNKYIVLGILLLFTTIMVIINIYIHKEEPKVVNPKELELTYEMNAGIPFKRIYEIEDESIVEFVRSYILKDENVGSIVGAPVYTNYVFKGLKEGTTAITFKVVSIDNDVDVMSESKNIVSVDKDMNISLVSSHNDNQ